MTSVRGAVATQQQARPTVEAFIGQIVPEIQRALPKGMDGDRIARLALTVVRKDRNLQQCDPYSFAGALLTAAALGLEVGTGEAHLVAYKGECTFIPDFKGLAKLFYQHPLARHLETGVVYERDHFRFKKGLHPVLEHEPHLGKDRGEIIAYYACATLSTGAESFEVLTPDEVKALRGGKVGPDPRFKGGDPQHWMERKTVLKQLLKLLPKSTTLAQVLDADEKTGRELAYERAVVDSGTMPAALEQAPEPPTSVEPEGTVDTATGVIVEDPPAEPDWPDTPPIPA